MNRLADRDAELMRVDEPCKRTAGLEPKVSEGQEVFILAEEHATKLGRPVKKLFITGLRSLILLCCEHINASPP